MVSDKVRLLSNVINIAILLSVALFILVSCGNNLPSSGDTTADATGGETKNDNCLSIIANGQSGYVIVRPDNASPDEIKAAVMIRDAIKEYTGVELALKNDFTSGSIKAARFEILVGKTQRIESVGEAEQLRFSDYVVNIIGDKLVITGGSGSATITAVETFIKKYLNGKADSLIFTQEMCFESVTDYPVSALKINGVDISEFVIVRPGDGNDSDIYSAEQLRLAVLALCGVNLNVSADSKKASGHELIVGNTNRGGLFPDSDAVIRASGGSVLIAGADSFNTRYATDAFISEYLAEGNIVDKELDIKISEQTIPAGENRRSVMSFNILSYVMKSETPQRAELVVSEILKYMPDSVGLQEVSADWMPILEKCLAEYYDYVGESNDSGGQNWRNVIFYRRDKLKVLDTQTRWLSSTPSKVSKFSYSNQYRILTWAVFEDIESGEVYAHFNTHMDYEEEARSPQLNVLLNLLDNCGYPIVLTGDFNFAESYKTYYSTLTSGKMHDSKYAAVEHDTSPTCGKSIIDYCFVTLETVNIYKQFVITDSTASDHNAVFTEFSIINKNT